MNSRLLIFPVLLLLALANCAWAWQLPYRYYNSWNVSISAGSEMLVGVNTSGPVRLMVLPQSEFYSYSNGDHYEAAYNSTVNSGVYSISLSQGEYTAIVDAAFSAVTIDAHVTAARVSQVRQAYINGVYHYPLSLSNYSDVNIAVISAVPIRMNMTDTYHNATFNNYLYGSNWDINLNRGRHVINFSSDTQTQAFIVINATPTLINPIPYGDYSGEAFPMGVASYGLNNYTGIPTPYVIKTNLIEGGANITAIYAYNASPPANVSQYGAGLQLNVIMEVISGNKNYTYWLQDVLAVSTNNQTYDIENNIWNFSSANADMSDGTVSGMGRVYETKATWSNSSGSAKYYAYSRPDSEYTFPLYFYPVIFARVLNGNPVVSFGYYASSGIYYYDNITFSMPASDAYILVTPFYKTLDGVPYDAEFVFGGQHSGEITSFSQMNASLYLYYNSSGTITSFPAVYSFGSETAEAATNLRTSSSPHGVHVSVGTPNLTKSYIYLAPNPTTSITTVATTTINAQTTQTTTIFNSTTLSTTTIPSNSNGGKSGSSALYLVVGAVVIIAVLWALFKALMRLFKPKVPVQPGRKKASTKKW